ncbi:MAG: nuclear transport factor 2 family protein [Planctomycetes bacterium]|nr:nuclear transport factor 2 family protein [Planctomycetota bacterium]
MRTFLAVLFVCLFLSFELFSQQGDSDKDLLVLLTKMEKDSWVAMKAKNEEFFKTYMADDARGFMADGSEVLKDDFIKNLKDWDLESYSMGKTSLLQVKPGVCFIFYKLNYSGNHKGKKIKFDDLQSSSLYVLRDGKWQEIFYQETVMPKSSNVK